MGAPYAESTSWPASFGKQCEPMSEVFPGAYGTSVEHEPLPVRISTSTSASHPSLRRDCTSWLSAAKPPDEANGHSHASSGHAAEPRTPLLLVLFVVVMACIAGFAVVGVHLAVTYAGCPLGINGCNTFYGKQDKGYFLLRALSDVPVEFVHIAVAAIGALIYAQLVSWLPEDIAGQIRGGGTVQSLVAVATGERIRFEAALLRIFATCVYLGSGGTLGMEGPAIQVCTAVATLIGWGVGIRSVATQSLLASLGFSCGFAASFNSPLAGILFAMEELQHVSPRISTAIICIILVASVVSTAVVRACEGNRQVFDAAWGASVIDSGSGGSIDKVFGEQMWMLISVPIGVVCSLAGWCIVSALSFMHRKREEWLLDDRVPFTVLFVMQAVLAASVGALVYRETGFVGIWGIGAESLQKALDQDYDVSDYMIFAAGKMIAMILAVALRAPGDVLEPVLISGGFIGGTIGALLGKGALGEQAIKPCVIFGMVGLFASCFRFPLTPVVIVLELTGINTYTLILPTVLTGFTAIMISNRLNRPILDELMYQDGVDLHELAEAEMADHETQYGGIDYTCQMPSEDGSNSVRSACEDGPKRAISASSITSSRLGLFVGHNLLEESLLEQSRAGGVLRRSGTGLSRTSSRPSSRHSSRRPSEASQAGEPSNLGHRRPSTVSQDSAHSYASQGSLTHHPAPFVRATSPGQADTMVFSQLPGKRKQVLEEEKELARRSLSRKQKSENSDSVSRGDEAVDGLEEGTNKCEENLEATSGVQVRLTDMEEIDQNEKESDIIYV